MQNFFYFIQSCIQCVSKETRVEMRIILTEACLFVLGVIGIVFGCLYIQHTLDKAAEAKFYDQSHRCVATVTHQWFTWAPTDGSAPVQMCAGTQCVGAPIVGDAQTATLLLVIGNLTGVHADADACAGLLAGMQMAVPGHAVSRADVRHTLDYAMGRPGQYHARYSDRLGQVFVYNASATAPGANATLTPSTAAQGREFWMQHMPLGAVMILVSTAMMACGIAVDRSRGEGLRLQIEQHDEELQMLWPFSGPSRDSSRHHSPLN
jgi:hypothetical protein